MFIEGAAGRIVAYNDDVRPSDYSYASQYGVDKVNSFIRENYKMTTRAVLVTTYSSNQRGTCDVYAGAPTSQTRSLVLDEQIESENIETKSATSNVQLELSQIKVYPNPVKLNADISISSDDLIKSVEIYSLSGQKLQSFVVNKNQIKQSLSGMNMSQTGMYILRIKTYSCIKNEKVIVN